MSLHWNIKYLSIYLTYYDTTFPNLSGCLAKTNVVSKSSAIKALMSLAISSVSVALIQTVGQLVTLTSSPTRRYSFRKSKPLVMLSYGELLPHMTRKLYWITLNWKRTRRGADSPKFTFLSAAMARWSRFQLVSLCVCACLSQWLSGSYHFEGVVPRKQYLTGTSLGMCYRQ